MIATGDIAAYVAERLVKRDFEGKHFRDLLGARDLSLNEAITVIGRKIGKPDLKYVQFPYDDAAKGMTEMGISADVSRLFVEMGKALNDGLFAVNRPRTPENTTTTSIEDFAGEFARSLRPRQTARQAYGLQQSKAREKSGLSLYGQEKGSVDRN